MDVWLNTVLDFFNKWGGLLTFFAILLLLPPFNRLLTKINSWYDGRSARKALNSIANAKARKKKLLAEVQMIDELHGNPVILSSYMYLQLLYFARVILQFVVLAVLFAVIVDLFSGTVLDGFGETFILHSLINMLVAMLVVFGLTLIQTRLMTTTHTIRKVRHYNDFKTHTEKEIAQLDMYLKDSDTQPLDGNQKKVNENAKVEREL